MWCEISRSIWICFEELKRTVIDEDGIWSADAGVRDYDVDSGGREGVDGGLEEMELVCPFCDVAFHEADRSGKY